MDQFNVPSAMAVLGKALVAMLACVGLVPGVTPHVNLEVFHVRETPVALRAFE